VKLATMLVRVYLFVAFVVAFVVAVMIVAPLVVLAAPFTVYRFLRNKGASLGCLLERTGAFRLGDAERSEAVFQSRHTHGRRAGGIETTGARN
jgi:hypothetical protein